MKKKIILSGICVALAAGLFITNILASSPGSSQDPLVSKSYVDDKYERVMDIINNLEKKTAPSPSANMDTSQIVAKVLDELEKYEDTGDNGSSFVPFFTKAGDIILGNEGTEIILRSGTAVGHCPDSNGLVNITTGKEIFNNTTVDKNNLIIVPRRDGRGVRATSDTWFIIKGGFEMMQ